MSGRRVAALIACGATLVALTFAGLRFQLEDRLDRFVIVALVQSAVYAAAVWLIWRSGASRAVVFGIAALAIAMRIPVALAPPYLSNDAYRYVWDGRVEAAGFNPYRHAPADPELTALRDVEIYPQIASQYAPTIYPPLAEAMFFAVTRLSASVVAMKIAMAMLDVMTLLILARLLALEELPAARILVYAWHPLPLWEFAGSGHIDAVMIACSIAAFWAVRRGKAGLAGLLLAGATLTKFYPAVLAPPLYRRWDWKMPALFAAAIAVAYLPFLSAGWQVLGFLSGYTHQEGFDAGGAGFYLLALLRDLPGLGGVATLSYELGALAILAALSLIFVFRRDRAAPPYGMAAVLAALFTVFVSPHYAWYFSWLIVFACFVRSFALLWLTSACLLLYLLTDYVFEPSAQRLMIEAIIYAPFAALALVDLWYYRRLPTPRSQGNVG